MSTIRCERFHGLGPRLHKDGQYRFRWNLYVFRDGRSEFVGRLKEYVTTDGVYSPEIGGKRPRDARRYEA